MAVGTMGISVATEKALGLGGKKVGANEWHSFDDLLSYDLLELNDTKRGENYKKENI